MNVPDLFNRSQYGSEGPIFWSQLDDRARQVVRILAVQLAEDWSPEGAAFAAQFKARTLGLGWSQAYLEKLARSFIEIWEKSTDLVGPLVRVDFRRGWGRGWTTYADLPRDTRDPRWESCIDHHTACDCREAEHAEVVAEYRGEARAAAQVHHAAAAALRLHTPTSRRLRWDGSRSCGECDKPWPCSTYTVLRTAMGWLARNVEDVHPLVVEVPF